MEPLDESKKKPTEKKKEGKRERNAMKKNGNTARKKTRHEASRNQKMQNPAGLEGKRVGTHAGENASGNLTQTHMGKNKKPPGALPNKKKGRWGSGRSTKVDEEKTPAFQNPEGSPNRQAAGGQGGGEAKLKQILRGGWEKGGRPAFENTKPKPDIGRRQKVAAPPKKKIGRTGENSQDEKKRGGQRSFFEV